MNKVTNYFIAILFVNILVILSALFIEFFLKVKPCILCIYQRYPYYIITFLSLIYFLKKDLKIILILLIILTSLASITLSTYHVGIETGLIEETTSCKTSLNNNLSKDAILKQLESNLASSCKEVNFKLFGFSLASINIILSLILTTIYYKIYLWMKKNT
ncbi:MAG: disulfide bond formation protein B [Candidatus Fonsibacter ubiquis]|nr:disulfide bond formation protein B [Candidatus Fonsibacter ubiquis]NCU45946.1 disulfide bond formation protein B [Candidatus Fonsibacter ubiquis]NCU55491.1 disulfide bond formation protein B [Candidatus Fonsibacter ubiquis]NCU69019.1 disulfide bond formation protein B [Candidatus Fonsibacter ubiquis]